jgi:large subunit ribosomal protein L24
MRKEFSTAWKASRQVRKQRKYVANAPLHIKRKMASSHLSKELRTKYARRSFVVRKNDIVKVMLGEFKGKTGKVTAVDLTKMKIIIEGLQMTKKDGSKANVLFHPSNLMITELNLEDKKRMESIKKENKVEAKK